jgi:hypothetical protein
VDPVKPVKLTDILLLLIEALALSVFVFVTTRLEVDEDVEYKNPLADTLPPSFVTFAETRADVLCRFVAEIHVWLKVGIGGVIVVKLQTGP